MQDTNKLRAEQVPAIANDVQERAEEPVRTLRDLELMLVGGGDGEYGWP